MQTELSIRCPLCNDTVSRLLYRFHIDSERQVLENIKRQNPSWSGHDGICSRCVDYYHTEIVIAQRILPEIGPHFPVRTPDDFIILPTPLRLNADPKFTGKGVTICFIDSGFYPHPDLVNTKNRIKITLDITTGIATEFTEQREKQYIHDGYAWHGTMTSVVCAGDGYMSRGLYRGIASEAELVLLKVQDSEGRITNENIVKALEWILFNHRLYDIKIVNISLSAEDYDSYKTSTVDLLAEKLIDQGISIVAAVGNDEKAVIKPPANSLHVIAVGGIDDHNQLELDGIGLYHSSYGKTGDGLMKPDLTAHSIWLAAPILPGTAEKHHAEQLYSLVNLQDDCLVDAIETLPDGIKSAIADEGEHDIAHLRYKISRRVLETKFISGDYMHADGTSFAAPIVSSVIAQLLQADPELTPTQVRSILFNTALRLPTFPVERQGFGCIRPRKAILKAQKKEIRFQVNQSPYINRDNKTIQFFIQHSCAEQISLTGNFNNWTPDVLLMEPGQNGLWKIEIPLLPAGKYYYKFRIDDNRWVEDTDNPWREPDGLNGWNSILLVEM